ncbi:type II toxin-antitoxin system RelE/ParE family toxin [Bosea sp. RCC_152_1]|uniref:type II toxin-antitoxin system RelE family toxin n=1 Tax=Bosea sp. RCC_152_1 TaxID=3239228 RepID=UPI003524B6E9
MIRIDFGGRFKKALNGLPPDRRKAAIAAIGKFQQEPALPALKFRPLVGKGGHFIISAHHGDRVIMKRLADDHYELVDVGPHDNVYRRMTRG